MNRKELTDDFMKTRLINIMHRNSSRLLNTIPELADRGDGFAYLNAMRFDKVADEFLESLDEYMSLFADSVADYYKKKKEEKGE